MLFYTMFKDVTTLHDFLGFLIKNRYIICFGIRKIDSR